MMIAIAIGTVMVLTHFIYTQRQLKIARRQLVDVESDRASRNS